MEDLNKKITILEHTLVKNNAVFNIKKSNSLGIKKIEGFSKKYNFPKELIDFYLSYNGLFITWFSDDDILSLGRLHIPDIQTLKTYLEKTPKTALKSFSTFIKKGYIPFDVDIINTYVTFINVEKDSYQLVRIDSTHKELNLNFSISDYLKLGIDSGGLYHWQNYISKTTYNYFKPYSYDGFFEFLKDKLDSSSLDKFYKDAVPNHFSPSKTHSIKLNIPKNAKIKIKKEDLGGSNVEIRKAEVSIQGKLPNSFINWGYSTNSMEIHWILNKCYANFKILGVEKIFGGPNHSEAKAWKNSYASQLELHESHEKDYGHFFPFIFEESGDTVFRIENNEIVFYFIEDLEPQKIDLTFNQFTEKLALCAGISGWQILFTKQYSSNNPEIKDLIQKIKICFPNLNISTFLE